MRILALGDIVGLRTVDFLRENLWKYRKENKIDFVVANGENVNDIFGIGTKEAGELLELGVDVITTGNHAFGRRDIYDFLENSDKIIRPANYPAGTYGSGYTIVTVDGFRVLCINAQGTVYMESLSSPFEAVDRILEREKGNYDISMLDFHAEATSEKVAAGYYFDGRINIIFGTHTHVQTADEIILEGGSAYITDIGMTGPSDGVLGVDRECIIYRFKTKMPRHQMVADGKIQACGIAVDIDGDSGKIKKVERVRF